MKNLYLILICLLMLTNSIYAANNPSDKYKKKVPYTSSKKQTQNINNTNSNQNSTPLKPIAMKYLRGLMDNNDTIMRDAVFQFINKGANPTDSLLVEKCPYNKKDFPTITVNGKTLKGNRCVKLKYTYQEKNYEEGFCE